MAEHLVNGCFLSDKYRVQRLKSSENCSFDKLVLSFHDAAARPALKLFANLTTDKALAKDIKARLQTVEAK